MRKCKKSFKQLLIYQGGDGIFTAYLLARSSRGLSWELRGVGKTPQDAAKNAWGWFNDDESMWWCAGHTI